MRSMCRKQDHSNGPLGPLGPLPCLMSKLNRRAAVDTSEYSPAKAYTISGGFAKFLDPPLTPRRVRAPPTPSGPREVKLQSKRHTSLPPRTERGSGKACAAEPERLSPRERGRVHFEPRSGVDAPPRTVVIPRKKVCDAPAVCARR
jgi:hypothetical protein